MSLQLVFVGAILPGIHPTHIHGMHGQYDWMRAGRVHMPLRTESYLYQIDCRRQQELSNFLKFSAKLNS